MQTRILLVDDDPQGIEVARKILELEGYHVLCAVDGLDAIEKLKVEKLEQCSGFDLVVSDLRMPRMNGLELFKNILKTDSHLPVILMTAYGQVSDAVDAMKLGAVDFLMKPFKRNQLVTSVQKAIARSPKLHPLNKRKSQQDGILGVSLEIQTLNRMIDVTAQSDAPVLITGESGTGKELVARSLHIRGARKEKPFIAINCAAIPENLMESELFGFEKGSFTGAQNSREGLFEAADGGTLFLDEIGDMPLSLQTKLLRVLQDREIRRVGSSESKKVDVRVISATHKNLKKECIEGRFRSDLLFRIEVVSIEVPALRVRGEDILFLAQYFLEKSNLRYGKKVEDFSREARQILMEYPWPGNVRELQNIIERAVVLSSCSLISEQDFPDHLKEQKAISQIQIPIGITLEQVENLLIEKTLAYTGGDKNLTAKLLGVNSRTIYRKLGKTLNPPGE